MKTLIKLISFLMLLSAVLIGCAKNTPADFTDSSTDANRSSQVSSFGTNPGALTMYRYTPSNPKSPAPLVVAMHGCTQTAADYETQSGWSILAEKYGFYVVYPQQSSSNNSSKCFNWFESGDIARGGGEALSIKSMVDYMKSNYTIDASKVYVTGLSAGGYFTAVMMAAYPDVFAGGAVMAGGPYKCATSMTGAFSCMSPGVDKTPSAWKTLVTGAYSGYSGSYPTLMVFQGSSDSTVKPLNMTELVDQWTAVHNIDQTADTTSTLSGHEVKEYKNASGKTLVKTFLISGMGHAITVDPGTGETQGGATGSYAVDKNLYSSYYAASFWGIASLTPVETLPPVVASFTPSVSSGNVSVTVSATDDTAVTKMEIYLNGSLSKSVNAASISQSWTLYDGSYLITVKAYDAAGNVGSNQASFTVTGNPAPVDTTAPIVSNDKAAGTYDVSVTVTLTVNETAAIYYTTNGSTPSESSSVYSGPLTFTANTTLKYFAKDSAGNSSAVESRTYSINTITYTETATGTTTTHYMAKRLTSAEYIDLGNGTNTTGINPGKIKYGYLTSFTLYKLSSTGKWVTDQSI